MMPSGPMYNRPLNFRFSPSPFKLICTTCYMSKCLYFTMINMLFYSYRRTAPFKPSFYVWNEVLGSFPNSPPLTCASKKRSTKWYTLIHNFFIANWQIKCPRMIYLSDDLTPNKVKSGNLTLFDHRFFRTGCWNFKMIKKAC